MSVTLQIIGVAFLAVGFFLAFKAVEIGCERKQRRTAGGYVSEEGGEAVKLTEVTYRRLFNLGNYETATVELTASVDEGETAGYVVAYLRDEIKAMHAKGATK